MRERSILAAVLLLLGTAGGVTAAEDVGTRMGVRRGGEVTFEPYGPGVLFDALDPAVKKWYVPQELYNEYQWRSWEYTNYAREAYQRYVNTAIEGDYFYDVYGGFNTRGWLIFDWTVSEPGSAGNRLLKSGQFSQFFNRLVVASDSKGQYYASITVGEQLRSTLTPMTFSKPQFDGVQIDLATDKYEATFLASRPSGFKSDAINANERSNLTDLLGGRFVVQIGDFAKVGATYVNVFNAQTRGQAFVGNAFHGSLTEAQNADITEIAIRLADDSPEDLVGGAALFLEEIIITTKDGERHSNQRRLRNADGTTSNVLDYHPSMEGGYQRGGYRAADGRETIRLKYQLDGPEYRAAFGPPAADIEKVKFRLLVANDYRIDLTSNNQTNRLNQPVYLSDGIPERTVRAPGNVQDGSNQRFVEIEYGLPTANEVYGVTLEIQDVGGFRMQGEYDRNRQHKRYPRFGERDATKHAHFVEVADAWMLNLYKRAYPFFLYGEAYSMDDNYSTSSYIALEETDTGPVRYDSPTQSVFEMVDDNDDHDRRPDWQRRGAGAADDFVFPGWDENNDFIADFNQNNVDITRPNVSPDWEEPFLRYNVDRPQFLFGVDMNNNGWVDRFENDDQPDYPYKRDRRGYNVYAGAFLGPYSRLTVGRIDERELADDRSNTTNYLLLSYNQDFPRLGRVRVFGNLRRAQDDIKDDLLIWHITEGVAGEIIPREDPLPLRDAWANTLYLQFDQMRLEDVGFTTKLKYEVFRQVDYDKRQEAGDILRTEDVRETASFFGLISKLDYTWYLGNLRIQPRWKSEFQRHVPSLRDSELDRATTELRESGFLILRFPVMDRTNVQAGIEYMWSHQYRDDAKNTLAGSSRKELVGAVQVANQTAYLGYALYTQLGLRVSRNDVDFLEDTQTETFIFLTMHAGFGE